MTYRFLCMISMAVAMTAVNAQFTDYDISFEAVEIDGWSGVQSFAFGHAGSDVLIIGGRRDGLHLRQPFASFDIPGHNTSIMVLNLDTRESWSWDITGLPTDVEDQLSSTNLNFIQVEDKLILIGGYGYSRLKTDHVTFEGLIVVDIPALTAGVKNNSVDPGMFKYTSDPGFAVTGGHLLKLYDTYYLAGGQRFDGRYNPMNHATFTQAYTEEVRRFRLDPETLEYSWLAPFQDGELLHRRDLNIQPVIGHDGEEAFILYSGVFQKTADLPFLNAVYVDSNGVSEVPGLIQLFNHYHCAALPVFDETHREMTTIFFGGMAQYYMDGGKLIKDDNVPFVRTIARIVRNEDGEYYEERLDLEMPGLLGSSAEFVINPQLPQYPNEVLDWSDIDSDSVFLGYIIGGISSTARNIFFVNDGSQSITNPTILRVTATERVYTSTREDKEEDLFVHAFPNPSDGRMTVNFSMKKKGRVHIDLFDQEGQLIRELFEEELSAGWHSYDLIIPDLVNSGHYLLIVRSGESTGRCSVIIN